MSEKGIEEIGFEEPEAKPKEVIEKGTKTSKNKSNFLIVLGIIIIAIILVMFATGKIHVTKTEPENYAPEIKYHYDTNLNSLQGNVTLVVGVEDRDGDKMNVQFWVRENTSQDWKGIGNFEGGNGTYQMKTKYINGPLTNVSSVPKTCYWKVEVSDHKTYVIGEYEFKFTGKRN